jgi:hypothetical protein
MTWPWPCSESTGTILPAYVKALQQIRALGAVKKNKKVDAGAMKYSFADLAAVLDASSEVLTDNGLAVAQPPSDAGVHTMLLHESGEWLSFGALHIQTAQNTPQAQGSGLSFARRYAQLGALNIATEDDDGKAASTAAKAPRKAILRTPADAGIAGGAPGMNPGSPASSNQITRLQIRLKEVGIVKRDDAIATYIAFIGRTVTSSKQMTVAEASKVIDGLDKLDAGLIELVANDDGTLTVKDAA